MSKHESTPTETVAQGREDTDWQRLASAEPICILDPLAEVLGMVEEGEPLVITFPEVARAAGHACPAIAGAYRTTQIALDELYSDDLPVRSYITVTVGGEPSDPGLGPMANVIRHVTGAADETGFTGFGGYGGRDDLLSFGVVDAPGRAFRFKRTDTGDAVVVSFDPTSTNVDPGSGGGSPMKRLSQIVAGEASEEARTEFQDEWHTRVQRILDAPTDGGPFNVDYET